MSKLIAILLVGLLSPVLVHAGPDTPSKFDPTPYAPQKALYDFNFAEPKPRQSFGYVLNHIKALKEFGDFDKSQIVIVTHGNELHTMARKNRAIYPDMYDALKELNSLGVKIKICRNAARSRGYGPEDFYEFATVVPAAVIEIAKWQNEGFSYMYPAAASTNPRITREQLVEKHPELEMAD